MQDEIQDAPLATPEEAALIVKESTTALLWLAAIACIATGAGMLGGLPWALVAVGVGFALAAAALYFENGPQQKGLWIKGEVVDTTSGEKANIVPLSALHSP